MYNYKNKDLDLVGNVYIYIYITRVNYYLSLCTFINKNFMYYIYFSLIDKFKLYIQFFFLLLTMYYRYNILSKC